MFSRLAAPIQRSEKDLPAANSESCRAQTDALAYFPAPTNAAARDIASALAAWLPGMACRFSPGSSKSCVAPGYKVTAMSVPASRERSATCWQISGDTSSSDAPKNISIGAVEATRGASSDALPQPG